MDTYGEFQRLMADLREVQSPEYDQYRLAKGFDMLDEQPRAAGLDPIDDDAAVRMQARERRIDEDRATEAMFKALSPAGLAARRAEAADHSRRMADITAQLKTIRAETPATLEKAKVMSFDFVAARETLRQAAINGEAPALDLIKAENLLNKLEAGGGVMMKAMPTADDRVDEQRCRGLLSELIGAGALSAVQAAKYEALIHHRFG